MNDKTNAVGTRFIASAPTSIPAPSSISSPASSWDGSAAFRAYLQHFELTVLDVALAAHVRLSTVWSIGQGLPIRAEHAQAVRAALYQLTGAPFTEAIAVIPEEALPVAQGPHRIGQARLKKF